MAARPRDPEMAAPRRTVVPRRLVERMRRWAAGDVDGAPVDPDRVALLQRAIAELR